MKDNLENHDCGVIYGYHGFFDVSINEDDSGEYMVASMMYKNSEEVQRVVISHEWFMDFKQRMIAVHQGHYNGVSWRLFKLLMNSHVGK